MNSFSQSIEGALNRGELLVPLALAPLGQKLTVKEIIGGKSITSRLTSMGIIAGVTLEVLNSSCYGEGALIVSIGNTRLAIGRGMAFKIIVS